MKTITTTKIPVYFKPILWPYDFEKLDSQRNERDIVINAINYGNLVHWFWILKRYGRVEIARVIRGSRPAELRPGALRLAEIILGHRNV